MLTLETPKDVFSHLGEELGPSEWLTVTQEMIDKFAEATGDHQWIHVDVERAKRDATRFVRDSSAGECDRIAGCG